MTEELGKLYQRIDFLMNQLDWAEKQLDAYAGITGLPSYMINDALFVCKKWHVDFDQATADFEVRPQDDSLDQARSMMGQIAFHVIDRINDNFYEVTGLELFFELGGYDSTDLWLRYDDFQKISIKDLFEEDPSFYQKLNPTARRAVEDLVVRRNLDIDLSLPESQTKGRGR